MLFKSNTSGVNNKTHKPKTSKKNQREQDNQKKEITAHELIQPPKILNILNSRILFSLLSAIIVIIGSYLVVQYANGNYRLTKQGLLPESGLLNANSFPTGAQVFIDGELTTATDVTLYLSPGEYLVEIVKEGYSLWKKTLQIEKELVTQTNARLFPTAPSLTPLTFTGAENILPSPDGRKIVYYTASASTQAKNGLYVLELNDSLMPFQKTSRQIAEDVPLYNLADALLIWSPDSTQLMVLAELKHLLIDVNQKNNLLNLPDINFRRNQVLSEWEEEIYLRERQYLVEFPEEIVQVATQSAKNAYISPDKKKLLYTATASANLPENLVPPLPSTSTQTENRKIEPEKIYVYDAEEDKNFLIGTETGENTAVVKGLLADDILEKLPRTLLASPSAFTRLQGGNLAETVAKFNTYHNSLLINTLQWLPDSNHLVFVRNNHIEIIEFDGTNNTTIYSGPFAKNFLYPWPDGSRLVILTSFSPDSPKNLYSIELK
jgi:hypothetical protein